MEIIRQGKPELQVIETMYKKECPRCHCQFRFNVSDTHLISCAIDVYEYVICPWCKSKMEAYC